MTYMSCHRGINSINVYDDKIRESLDYSDPRSWAAHPFKNDNSDSLSLNYKGQINEDLVDIFFLHPTSFTNRKEKHVSNALISDSLLNSKTDNSSILYQASVFNQIGRIYAPRYRQAHLSRYFSSGDHQLKAFDFAYQDVAAAFKYYMENYNEGRPIILAAHSQGTTHAMRLIKEYVDNHRIQEKIIIFYLLGMPVNKNEFNMVKPCLCSTDVNCFLSWRTYRKGYDGEFVDKDNKAIHVSNPVNLENDTSWTSLQEKRESILWRYDIAYNRVLKSKVQGDMLWITRPRFKGGIVGLFMKNYHAGDINLFYGDIRKYVRDRVISSNGSAH